MDFHQAIPVFSVTVLQVRPPRRASVPCALRFHEIETLVSESSKRVLIFLYVCQGVKQVRFYSRLLDSGTAKKLEGPDPASWSMTEQKLSLG